MSIRIRYETRIVRTRWFWEFRDGDTVAGLIADLRKLPLTANLIALADRDLSPLELEFQEEKVTEFTPGQEKADGGAL